MKSKRHKRIVQLIQENDISTQEKILEMLKQDNYNVTQATVSRDIKDLGLIKTTINGVYKYVSNTGKNADFHIANKFKIFFLESAINIDYAGNTVIVQCYSGMANAACATIDAIKWEGLVGTLSGDDTFIMLTRSEELAEKLCTQLRNILNN